MTGIFSVEGVLAALSVYVLLVFTGVTSWMGKRTEAVIDIAFTAFLFWYFKGTFSGAMTGVTGGLVLSLLLYVHRNTREFITGK